MANWHESKNHADPQPRKRGRFGGRGKGPKSEAAPQAVPDIGLRDERRRLVEAYYGVYPADADARSRANLALRYPSAQLEAAG
jgi:hypothetical protein